MTLLRGVLWLGVMVCVVIVATMTSVAMMQMLASIWYEVTT